MKMKSHGQSKIRVGLMFGGKSAEHEVSLVSAKNVLDALDTDKFEPVLIGIDKQGKWHLNDAAVLLGAGAVGQLKRIDTNTPALTLLPGGGGQELVDSASGGAAAKIDVVFPILHGPMGEDGTIQGFLELANVPYVGPSVLGAAIGMDKDVMKRLLRDAGIEVTKYICVKRHEIHNLRPDEIVRRLGLPLFVKPANMGSSVGVTKVLKEAELSPAMEIAFSFDTKILIEAAVIGDEVECAILGNHEPKASLPGRILPNDDFYSYEAKYIDEDGAAMEIPAKLDPATLKKIQATAIKAYTILEGQGMARVDMFLTKSGKVVMNEVNTIPGFTKISMYPKLWEASGLAYKDLISELITLAMDRFREREELQTSYLSKLT